jgi:hypothetical protein
VGLDPLRALRGRALRPRLPRRPRRGGGCPAGRPPPERAVSIDPQGAEAVYGDVAAEARCLVYALSHHLAVLGTCAAASQEYFERRCTKVFKRLAHLGLLSSYGPKGQ